jgi:hypothetical protein
MHAQQTFADWSVWSAPLVELQQINQAALEKVTREFISFYSDKAAETAKAVQILQRTNSPEDFFPTLLKMATKQSEQNLEFIQNIFQIYQNVIKEHCQWTEEKVNTAVKTAGKSAKDLKRGAEEQH